MLSKHLILRNFLLIIFLPPEKQRYLSQIKYHFIISCCPTEHLSDIVQFSCLVVSDSLWSHGLQHARLPCSSLSPWVWSNSCPLSQWCYLTISSSVTPFSSCLQSFPASGFFSNNSALCIILFKVLHCNIKNVYFCACFYVLFVWKVLWIYYSTVLCKSTLLVGYLG